MFDDAIWKLYLVGKSLEIEQQKIGYSGRIEGISFGAIIIFLFPAIAAVGPYLIPFEIGGINLFLFRVLIIAIIFWMIVMSPRLSWLRFELVRSYAVLGLVWITWGAASIFWTPNVGEGVYEILAISFGFLVAPALLNFHTEKFKFISALRRGWVLSFIITGLVAVWELTTGNHLPGSFVSAAKDYELIFIAISTFTQPNNFGAYLVLLTPFLIWSLVDANSVFLKVFYIFLIGCALVLAILSTSKVGVFGVLLIYLLALFMFGNFILATALFVGMSFVVILFGSDLLEQTDIPFLFEIGYLMSNTGAIGESIGPRPNLVLSGIIFVSDTFGLGTGAGSFIHLMERGGAGLPTKGITQPHNFFIEILSQYGMIVITLFIFFWLKVIKIPMALRKIGSPQALRNANIIILLVIGYAFASLSNSYYILDPMNWLFLATVAIIGESVQRGLIKVKEGVVQNRIQMGLSRQGR